MIIIHPYGGLCNRMRCIDSGIHLARELGQEMTVIWQPTSELNACFEDLFSPPGSFLIREHPPPLISRAVFGKRPSHCLLRAVFKKTNNLLLLEGRLKHIFREENVLSQLSPYRNIYVYSDDRFMYPEVYDAFRPTERIQRVVDAFTRRFREDTVGIHIRRTDHEQATRESPISLFVERMEDRLNKDPKANFFLATDDITVKRMLTERFGGAVITQEAELSRKTKSGVAAAVVDLFVLAQTGTIWGSYGSSFCETAHYLGNNDFILLRRKNHAANSSDRVAGAGKQSA